jgi:hypothetical protein
MTTFRDVLPVDFKQTSDLLHSKIVERRFFRLGHTRRMEDIDIYYNCPNFREKK